MQPSFSEQLYTLDTRLNRNINFDVIQTRMQTGGKNAAYYYIDGFVRVESLIKIHETLIKIKPQDISESIQNTFDMATQFIPQISFSSTEDVTVAMDAILKGMAILLMDGFSDILILDIRMYPQKETKEPEKNRTLRGPHEGFVENILQNTILIRRRLTTPSLIFEKIPLGISAKTDVIMAYLDGQVDQKFVSDLREKLKGLKMQYLTMSQETITEHLFFKNKFWAKWNPLPRVRYIERPDTAVAQLTEGKILILTDASPAVIVLPVCIYDFFEETEDYYFPPFTGSYLRIIRFIIFIGSIMLAPLWLLSFEYRDILPDSLSFLDVTDSYTIPIFTQLLILEFAIDGIKIASLNTPSTLSNSLSVVGGLLLGDFAVKAGWFVPDTILCAAFTALSNFIPANYELGYSSKFARLLLIILVSLFQIFGLLSGLLLIAVVLLKTKTIENRSYLYPIYPYNHKVFFRLFFRSTQGKETN